MKGQGSGKGVFVILVGRGEQGRSRAQEGHLLMDWTPLWQWCGDERAASGHIKGDGVDSR